MAIFSPATKPFTLVTGTLIAPAGILTTGPSGRGCHSVVLLLAAVPTLPILRVSTPEPVSMLIVSPTDMLVVLLTWMVLSPARAGTASPEVERPRREKPRAASLVQIGRAPGRGRRQSSEGAG